MEIEARGGLDDILEAKLVGFLIALGARRANAGTLAGIQKAPLDGSGVGILGHNPTQSVNLPHDVPFGQSANGWITTHLTDGIEVLSQKGDRATGSRGSESGLYSSVTAPDDEDMIVFGVSEHGASLAMNSGE
jgi:hypothetical protein